MLNKVYHYFVIFLNFSYFILNSSYNLIHSSIPEISVFNHKKNSSSKFFSASLLMMCFSNYTSSVMLIIKHQLEHIFLLHYIIPTPLSFVMRSPGNCCFYYLHDILITFSTA